jgi:uncharacterized membrane protein YkoI
MATRRVFLSLTIWGMIGPAIPAALAEDDGGSDGGGDDHEDNHQGSDDGSKSSGSGTGSNNHDTSDGFRIRRAVSEGRARPLKEILATVHQKYQGDIIRIRLDGSGNKLVYHIRIIDPSNQLFEVLVNAGTGKIVGPAGLY